MLRLRKFIKSNPVLWLVFLVPALVLMLSTQLHVHIHDHVHNHTSNVGQHSHSHWVHKTHLGNIHDAKHASDFQHNTSEITAVDISPEGLSKYFASVLLAAILITVILLLYSPFTKSQRFSRCIDDLPLRHWCNGSPPQLRAPPSPF